MSRAIPPSYDLRAVTLKEIRPLFETYHGYKSVSATATYAFAVIEETRPVAAFAWQPPPPGAAKSVCTEAPAGVLALSRMAAVPRSDRQLRHISTPLRRQMRLLIDRGRWPVLVTFHDEGQGHTGHVYKCSGWKPTLRAKRSVYEDTTGARQSRYANGRTGRRDLIPKGHTWLQRWEHWACVPGSAATWMSEHGWVREPIPGKRWKSGNQAYRYVQQEAE